MSNTLLLSLCPCGSQKKFTDCCEPLISGKQKATSPEALMRSRYTSFTLQDVDYLFSSMTPELQQETDREDMADFAGEVDSWVKLEVINAPTPNADHGNVEFAAYFMYDGEQQRIHENSQFVQKDGQWFYAGHEHQCSSHDHDHDENDENDDHGDYSDHDHVHDEHCGHHHHHAPYVADEKIGRNDPCPCGSGKKYKKCCID